MLFSDWSSVVCSSDLILDAAAPAEHGADPVDIIIGDARRRIDAEQIGARRVAEQRHADLAIALKRLDRAAEVGHRIARRAAGLRQEVAAAFLAVLAVIDAEGGAAGAGRKLEQLAGDDGLAGLFANRQFLMQIVAATGVPFRRAS